MSGYKRVLLKLSGEALMGSGEFGIDPVVLDSYARQVSECAALGVQVALVIGGGNLFRGAGLAAAGMNRVSGDHMGMLATVMNALAMQDALGRAGVTAHVMSAFEMGPVCELFSARAAIRHLEAGHVTIFAAGTGNPFFTTDSAASLRAVEIGADVLFKATKVDGVYAADPMKHPDAERYVRLSYDEVLARQLMVMDATAIVLCRDNRMPLRIFDINKDGAMLRAVKGEDVGSLVERG